MISVIVPVYNVEKYLDRCVQSILHQTYQDFELILVDDGSTDKSGEMCNQYAKQDKRVRVIHQENRGLSGARNAGLEKCNGNYITFIDSDDEIDPITFETITRFQLQKNYDLTIYGHCSITEDQLPTPVNTKRFDSCELDRQGLWEEVFGRLNNSSCNKLYKREVIGQLRFPIGIIHGEDLIFNLQYISECSSTIMIDAPFYCYRQRAQSITNSGFNEKKFYEIAAKDKALEIVRKNCPEQEKNGLKYCFRARMNVCRSMVRSHKDTEFKEQYKECKKYVKQHYSDVKRVIRPKERIEYYLFRYFESIYKTVTREL